MIEEKLTEYIEKIYSDQGHKPHFIQCTYTFFAWWCDISEEKAKEWLEKNAEPMGEGWFQVRLPLNPK